MCIRDRSWQQQVKSGNKGAEWNGVRNFQAAKNLRSMKVGDKCFFYHTGKTKSVVGIVELTKEAFFDNRPRVINEPDSNSSVYLARNLGKAAAIIAVCAPNSNPSGLGAIRTFASIFTAIQNMLLTARSIGLGGNITINHILRHEEIKESLKIPADKQIIALIPMGYPGAPEKHGPKRRKSVIEVSWSENWGAPLAFE